MYLIMITLLKTRHRFLYFIFLIAEEIDLSTFLRLFNARDGFPQTTAPEPMTKNKANSM